MLDYAYLRLHGSINKAYWTSFDVADGIPVRFAPGTSSSQKFPRVMAYPIPGRNRLLMPLVLRFAYAANPLRPFLSKEIFYSPTPETGFGKILPKGNIHL